MFEKYEEASRMIKSRTSKIIGGYLTESLFIEKYRIEHPDRAYSKGWWGGIEKSPNATLTFFVVKNELTELDRDVIRRLEEHNYCWKQVVLINNELYIKDFENEVGIQEFVESQGMEYKGVADLLNLRARNDELLDQCIEAYKERGMLQEIATSIYIEDSFLNKYYTISNIDLICQDDCGTPIYCEIKFKNGFYKYIMGINKLVFGVDKFQYDNLFKAFLLCGMKVENVILYNDIKKDHNVDNTLIIDFLKEKSNQNIFWKTKEITLDDKYTESTFSNGRTAWNGQGERTVYCIPLTDYKDFGSSSLSSDSIKYFNSGAWGICSFHNCGAKKVIRLNTKRKEEFIGCLNYKNHLNNRDN